MNEETKAVKKIKNPVIYMKIKLFSAFACGAVIALSPALRAQDTSTVPAATSPTAAVSPAGEHHHGGGQLEKLTKDLSLTPDQVEKIKPILEDRRAKMKALRDDTSVPAAQNKDKMKEIFESSNQQIKAILTPDQATKFEQLMQEMKDHRKQTQQTAPAASTTATP